VYSITLAIVNSDAMKGLRSDQRLLSPPLDETRDALQGHCAFVSVESRACLFATIHKSVEFTLAPGSQLRTGACSAGRGTWTELDLEAEISKRTFCTVARAFAIALYTDGGCFPAGIMYDSLGATCPDPSNTTAVV
jgi:hypothetical protein